MTRHRTPVLPLLLLALGGCSGAECDCIGPVPVVTSVVITGVPTVPFRVGNRIRLTAEVRATGVIVNSTVIWRTSAPAVIAIDQDGLATAAGVGTATVEAIASADTTKRASAVIRVEAAQPAIALRR